LDNHSFTHVLLGIRTVFKDDLGCSTVELLYGTTLRIPGEFFEDSEQPVKPEIFQKLRERIRRIRAKPTAHHNKITPFMYKDLQTTHVFVGDDTVRRPLQPPYLGPYEVLAKINERLYTVLINNRPSNISEIKTSIPPNRRNRTPGTRTITSIDRSQGSNVGRNIA